MALIQGYVVKVAAVSGAEPVGRITIGMDGAVPADFTQINCASGPKFDLAMLAFQMGNLLEVDVLATTNPMVADKIRVV